MIKIDMPLKRCDLPLVLKALRVFDVKIRSRTGTHTAYRCFKAVSSGSSRISDSQIVVLVEGAVRTVPNRTVCV